MPASKSNHNLVIVSGYYGFGNLGDEAILEELVSELKRLLPAERIVVASESPAETEAAFGVKSVLRTDLGTIGRLLRKATLLVSGGGGLFQDTKSPGSAIFYGSHIFLARYLGVRTIIYAQGVGPLHSTLATVVTRAAFRQCQAITVRDKASLALVRSWGLNPELTADPVWCLEATSLPWTLKAAVAKMERGKSAERPLVGLSLRESPNLTENHRRDLEASLIDALPNGARLVLLPLQKTVDQGLLMRFKQSWCDRGREAAWFNPDEIRSPSQWISLISKLDLLVSMRLHAAIMALRSGVPTVGVAYDPKVKNLLTEFDQPILNLTNQGQKEVWTEAIKSAFDRRDELSASAVGKAEAAKNLACQNFNVLSRMLSMQSDP